MMLEKMKFGFRNVLFFTLVISLNCGAGLLSKPKIKIACVGDSITFGARLENPENDSYPAQFQKLLGDGYVVSNFGVGGATLLRKGRPTVWNQLSKIMESKPDVVVISLGTNDTCGMGTCHERKCWDYNDEFPIDYSALIDTLRTLTTKPKIWICAPTPMVMETPGLSEERVEGLSIREPRLQSLISHIRQLAKDKDTGFIDLNTPMSQRPELFTIKDGVHPNKEGYSYVADLVHDAFVHEVSDTLWKGFKRRNFVFESKKARLIFPEKPLKGNPWIWRARFPDWHTKADSILISDGFHLAYIDTNNKFGSPKAMAIWDEFYNYLTEKYQLQEKVALYGVSRGGLFVYNWAKRNPEKVSCIYAEAPVCDFKSWPLGKGEFKGNRKIWGDLKNEYGFKTNREAKKYKNNPKDNLDVLAKANVPVLHMISLQDKIVPPEENTFILVNKYIRLGGTATVISSNKGLKLSGHHFEINTPERVADFIKYNSCFSER